MKSLLFFALGHLWIPSSFAVQFEALENYSETSSPLFTTPHIHSEEADLEWDVPGSNFEPKVQMAWGAMTRPWTRNLILEELGKSAKVTSLPFSRLDQKTSDLRNPFLITPGDFWTLFHRSWAPHPAGPAPQVAPGELTWFDDQVQKSALPTVFVIGGHHVISQGYHNDPETMFMYTPTLLKTIRSYPSARQYFDSVKFAVLWGCNTLTDLEPHGPNGEHLDPQQIEALYRTSPEGKTQVIGTAQANNTLEFYRARLAREYGEWRAKEGKYEYTRNPKKERCEGTSTAPYQNCKVTNVDRILPDRLLWDGDHALNGGLVHREIFRNARLVLGYNSASPSEEGRVKIFETALKQTKEDLNRGIAPSSPDYVANPIAEIISDQTPAPRLERIIQVFRSAWTEATTRLNRARPSGSITPALPQLDSDGMFVLDPEVNAQRPANQKIKHSPQAPLYWPYRN